MKRLYLIVSILVIGLSLAGFLGMLLVPTHIHQQTALVNYTQTGNFSYLIYLKPSYLYGTGPSIAANPRYPVAAVGSIDFTYSFVPVVKQAGTTQVECLLENPGIWQKTITLLPETPINGNFNLSFSLDINQINILFNSIEQATGIATTPRSLTINVRTTAGGDSFVQSLPLTMDKNLIEISSNLNQSIPQGNGSFDYVLNQNNASTGSQSLPSAKYPAGIVTSLDFTFSFQPASAGPLEASAQAVLANSDVWQKSLELAPQAPISNDSPLRFTLNLDDIRKNFDAIDNQTGLTTVTRNVTVQVSLVQGNDKFVQSWPLSLHSNIVEMPGDSQVVQPEGTGFFDYVLNLKPNTLFDTSTYHPPQASSTPNPTSAPLYSIFPKPTLAPQSPETILAPGQTAFTKLIDKMDVTFSYRFQSSQPVDGLSTQADISAVLEAPKFWSKTFPILHAAKSGNFDQTFTLDIANYNTILQAITSETGVPADSYSLSVSANLHTTGQTHVGAIDQVFNPILKGTISNGILSWDKNTSFNQSGSINTGTTVVNPHKYLGLSAQTFKNTALVLAVIFLLGFGLLLALYLRAKPAELSELEKEAVAIKKKYAVRLVEALDQSPPEVERTIALNSMEDLIKVADELAKPVIYRSPGPGQAPRFYFILDGTTRYEYSLEAPVPAPQSQA